jgi:hypothetical protein
MGTPSGITTRWFWGYGVNGRNFENFADLRIINFENFAFFGGINFEERNKTLFLQCQISKLWNRRDSLSEKSTTVSSNGSKKAMGIVLSS